MLPLDPDTLLQQRYRILNLLGEGEFGRIYLAADRGRADAPCTIEELIPSAKFPSTVAKAKEFFKQESTLLYQLQHPQIPQFWTSFEEQERFFLVRDYIEGKTYQDLLEDRRDLGTAFTEAEVWRLLLQILPVIGYVHSKGVIHKNISPAHLLCRDHDQLPVLINFGVVKEFATKLQASPVTQTGLVGEFGYAPVEQLKSGQVYPNSDLYALAVTAIVLLTGKEPSALFQGDLINWDWRKWTQISDDFANVLGRMSSPHPNDRYQSAIEVERDLQALSIPSNEPAAPTPPQPHRSTIPTVAVGSKSTPSATNRIQTAITNLNVQSIWEKPQVFIPVGLLISLLAGFGSWFGVTQLRSSRAPEPVVSTPPKQIDFNNPTIPNDSGSPEPTASDSLQPELDRPIVKEGNVDPNTPVRFKIAAVAGQNLDIQLVPVSSQKTDAIDSPASISSPIAPINPSPNQKKDPKFSNPPISVPSSIAATQVLMTIISPTGSPIDPQADRVLGWRGQIPTSGDYTIELRSIKGLTGKTFPYKLNIAQLATIPSPSPIPSNPPGTESTSPIGAPLPSSGTGIKANPTIPNPNSPSDTNSPRVSPSPIPIIVPTPTPIESERPTQNRRRNRTEAEPSRQVRERERVKTSEETPTPRRRRARVESSEEATPTPRRRRERVESSEDVTPTPRRRSNRQTNSQPEAKPSPSPQADVNDNESSTIPKSEPQIGIPVPLPKNSTPQPNKTDGDATPSPGSTLNDPD
jgi:serine/threonine protein kinase